MGGGWIRRVSLPLLALGHLKGLLSGRQVERSVPGEGGKSVGTGGGGGESGIKGGGVPERID